MQERKTVGNQTFVEEPFFFGLLARKFDQKTESWVICANYKRIALAALAAFVAGWLMLSAAVFSFFRFVRGFEQMSFADAFCMPFKISKHRKNLGEYNIKQAEEFFAQKRFSDGFMALTSGVYRSPNNLEARKALASIHMFSLRNPEYASAILEHKLNEAFAAKDAQYITLAAAFFSRSQAYEKKSVMLLGKAYAQKILTSKEINTILAGVNSALSRGDAPWFEAYFGAVMASPAFSPKIKAFAAKAMATFYMRTNRFAEAMRVLEEGGIDSGMVFAQAKMFDMYARGEEIEAIKYAQAILANGRDVALSYAFLERAHTDYGNEIDARSAARLAILTSRDSNEIKALSIVENGDVEALHQAASGANGAFMLSKIAKLSAKMNAPGLIRECLKAAKKMPPKDAVALNLMCAESLMRLGKTDGVEEILREQKSRNKGAGVDEIIDDLMFIFAVLNNVATEKHFADFKAAEHKAARVVALADILRGNAKYDAYIDLLLYAKTLGGAPEADANLVGAYFAKGDIADAARLVCNSPQRCPAKILCALAAHMDSDKFIMLAEDQRKILRKRASDALERMREYKKMYAF